MFGVFDVSVPAPVGGPPGSTSEAQGEAARRHRAVAANAIKTPQFWLLWTVLSCNVTAGIGILEQASPMIQDFFREGGSVRRWRPPPRRRSSAYCHLQHGRAVRLVVHFGLPGPQADLRHVPRRRHGPVLPARGCRHSATAVFVLLAGVIISFYGGGFATVPPTCATCSAPTRSAPSTAGCSPPGPPRGSRARSSSTASSTHKANRASSSTPTTGLPVHHGRRTRGRLRGEPAGPPGGGQVPRVGTQRRVRRSRRRDPAARR